jgi:hypothetical protein
MRLAIGVVLLFLFGSNTTHAQSIQINNVSFELGLTKKEAATRCVRAGNLVLVLKGRDSNLVEDKIGRIAYGSLTFRAGRLAKIEKYWLPQHLGSTGRSLRSAEIFSLVFYQAARNITTSSNCKPTTVEENDPRLKRNAVSIVCSYPGYQRSILVETKTVRVLHGRTTDVGITEVIANNNRPQDQ